MIFLLVLIFLFACGDEQEPEVMICSVSYEEDIYPILDVACTQVGCHHTESQNGDLTQYIGAKEMVEDGSMWFRVLVTRDMPVGIKLDSTQLSAIQVWIEEGAKEN